jgi:hypothetical protein
MKTLNYDVVIKHADYERPAMRMIGTEAVYDGFVVLKIEECNMRDSIIDKTFRAYKIHWKNKMGQPKCFYCGLGSNTYKRFVVPNMGKCVSMTK